MGRLSWRARYWPGLTPLEQVVAGFGDAEENPIAGQIGR
jgi:hypothetical protein